MCSSFRSFSLPSSFVFKLTFSESIKHTYSLFSMSLCVHARVCVLALCVCTWSYACVCICMHVCASACTWSCVWMCVCVFHYALYKYVFLFLCHWVCASMHSMLFFTRVVKCFKLLEVLCKFLIKKEKVLSLLLLLKEDWAEVDYQSERVVNWAEVDYQSQRVVNTLV